MPPCCQPACPRTVSCIAHQGGECRQQYLQGTLWHGTNAGTMCNISAVHTRRQAQRRLRSLALVLDLTSGPEAALILCVAMMLCPMAQPSPAASTTWLPRMAVRCIQGGTAAEGWHANQQLDKRDPGSRCLPTTMLLDPPACTTHGLCSTAPFICGTTIENEGERSAGRQASTTAPCTA